MNYGGEAGLFPVMARANHSCCPNADFVSRTDLGEHVQFVQCYEILCHQLRQLSTDCNRETICIIACPGVQLLVATAAITVGEEVFISYLPQCQEGSDVRKVRQNYLKTYYGFRCTCAVCAMKVSLYVLF